MRWAPIIATVVAATGAVAVLGWATDGFRAFTAEAARRLAVVERSPVVPSVRVETMDGTWITVPPVDGRATVVEFVYTGCPTICRVSGEALARLRARLVETGLAGRVLIVTLSFDPQTDTPESLADWGRRHGADGRVWTVARPRPADLPALLDAYGIVVIPDGAGGWVHNAALHVIDPSGRLRAILDVEDVRGAEAAVRDALG